MAHLTWADSHPYGIGGAVPFSIGGAFLTAGAILLNRDQEQRWGPPPGNVPAHTRGGAAMLLSGALTLAASATVFTWGLEELSLRDNVCPEVELAYPCPTFRPELAALILSSAGAGMLLGTGLIIGGAHRRRRYLEWRRPSSELVLRPRGWAGPRGFGFGLGGRF